MSLAALFPSKQRKQADKAIRNEGVEGTTFNNSKEPAKLEQKPFTFDFSLGDVEGLKNTAKKKKKKSSKEKEAVPVELHEDSNHDTVPPADDVSEMDGADDVSEMDGAAAALKSKKKKKKKKSAAGVSETTTSEPVVKEVLLPPPGFAAKPGIPTSSLNMSTGPVTREEKPHSGLTLESWRDPSITETERQRRRYGSGIRNMAAIQKKVSSSVTTTDTAGAQTSGTSVFAFGFDFFNATPANKGGKGR